MQVIKTVSRRKRLTRCFCAGGEGSQKPHGCKRAVNMASIDWTAPGNLMKGNTKAFRKLTCTGRILAKSFEVPRKEKMQKH